MPSFPSSLPPLHSVSFWSAIQLVVPFREVLLYSIKFFFIHIGYLWIFFVFIIFCFNFCSVFPPAFNDVQIFYVRLGLSKALFIFYGYFVIFLPVCAMHAQAACALPAVLWVQISTWIAVFRSLFKYSQLWDCFLYHPIFPCCLSILTLQSCDFTHLYVCLVLATFLIPSPAR